MSKQDKEKSISIVIGHILNILLFIVSILIIIGVYYIVQIKVFQNDYSNLFGYTFFEVATGSMSSTIEIGDIVVVKITKEVNKNDILKSWYDAMDEIYLCYMTEQDKFHNLKFDNYRENI